METQWVGNAVWRWLTFLILILVALAVGRLGRLLLEQGATRVRKQNRDTLAVLLHALAKPIVLLTFTAVLWLCVKGEVLVLPESLLSVAITVIRVLGAIALGYAVYSLVDLVDYYLHGLAGRTDSKVDDILLPLVGKSVRITVCVLVVVQVVQTLSDRPLTSILAGLGVGGLAVALAGQDTIRNFFGSLVIVADKPFEIGDRIVVEGQDGPVESVGFRSTRIRTLDGHLVTVPNAEMVNKTVRNIGKRPYIKRTANITVTYDTPPEKVDRAVEILKEILDNHEGMHPEFPPRVFFSDFNDWSLNLVMLYWYHPPDYWSYMAFTEKVNRQILRRFNEESIEFAFPSRTVYLAGQAAQDSAGPLGRQQDACSC